MTVIIKPELFGTLIDALNTLILPNDPAQKHT